MLSFRATLRATGSAVSRAGARRLLSTVEPTTVKISAKDLGPGGSGVNIRTLERAFGKDSLGIVLINELPDSYSNLRRRVLSQASFLLQLPAKSLEALEAPEAFYLVGWSRGKEKLASGLPDTNKGSYYINCSFYKDPKLEGPPPEDCKGFEDYKAYTEWNRWPDETQLKGLRSFEKNCKDLISIIVDVGSQVAKFCDAYCQVKRITTRNRGISQMIRESTTSKARLLHYYPVPGSSPTAAEDDWCGEHNDHSILTGLTSPLYLEDIGGMYQDADMSNDANCGLFIKDRHGNPVKVDIPEDCLAFQTGSALEELTKGSFKAVPHYVHGPSVPDVCRNTLAVFLQPSLAEKVNDDETFAAFAKRILQANH